MKEFKIDREQGKKLFIKCIEAVLFLTVFYFSGAGIAAYFTPQDASKVMSDIIVPASTDWGLGGYGEPGSGQIPSGMASQSELSKYHTYYLGDTSSKIIYLTFDAGYENGNTPAILQALKKHNVKATFFLVGNYLETSPALVKRMVEDGHTVGNHTFHHPDMSAINSRQEFEKELKDLEMAYEQLIGKPIEKYYRPPQGKYCKENLEMASAMGYSTFFWSLAYVDWNVNDQPTYEEAMEKLTARIHPGAIVLLHSTSKTNGEIMDDLLTKWEEMGYTFGRLSDIIKSANNESKE